MTKLIIQTTIALFLLSRQTTQALLASTQTAVFHPSAAASIHKLPLNRLALISRRSLLIATMTSTSSSSSSLHSDTNLQQSITLLNSIYAPVNSSNFPLPMSPNEAGPCSFSFNSIPQRRYLWTDAFAVTAYQSISEIYSRRCQDEQAAMYKEAVEKLIDTVHECLGKPRSERREDGMEICGVSPTGFVGLRIGKVESKVDTDFGMKYDGQYFHYIDKWLFALSRTNHIQDGLRIAKSIFPYFFEKSKYGTGGIRWKLSVNASPPSLLPPIHGPNDDTLNALIVYTLLESKRGDQWPSLSLQNEIQMLQNVLRHYHPRVTDDPLGWGIESIFDQFVSGHPRAHQLRTLASDALSPSHISLPFRLYGALIGATVSNERLVAEDELERIREFCIKYQFGEVEKSSDGKYVENFAEINRVMLAVALLGRGSCFCRMDGDPMVQL